MSRHQAGDEANQALVAYVRDLSDEELADLLSRWNPRSIRTCLNGRSGSNRISDHRGIKHDPGTLVWGVRVALGQAKRTAEMALS
jgi:hypothetical protein